MVSQRIIDLGRFILFPLCIGVILFVTLLDARSNSVINADQIEEDVEALNVMLAAHIMRMDEFCVNFELSE